MTQIQLTDAPFGRKVRLLGYSLEPGLRRRMRGLGLSPGVELELVHRRGEGVVVANGENRVALGGDLARRLPVEIIDE